MSEIKVTLPAACDTPFLLRRDFLANMRSAIGKAQIEGTITAAMAVELFKALPPATPGDR